jgi:hypothetical protein
MIIANTLTTTELAFVFRVLSIAKCSSSKSEALRVSASEKIARMQQRLAAEAEARAKLEASRIEAERGSAIYTNAMPARGYRSPQLRKAPAPKILAGSLEHAEKERLAQLSDEALLGELGL